jgi:H+/gluconate symporter-like permease
MLACKKYMVDLDSLIISGLFFSILCDMIFIFLQKFTKKSEKLVEFTQRVEKKKTP